MDPLILIEHVLLIGPGDQVNRPIILTEHVLSTEPGDQVNGPTDSY